MDRLAKYDPCSLAYGLSTLQKLQRQSSRLILTAAFCHLVLQRAIIYDIISTKLIKECDQKFLLRFKEE